MSHPLWYTIYKMMKNGKRQNVVSTTSEQNMAAAKVCETYNEAVRLFRSLEYANNRGTAEQHFDMLEEHFIAKQGLQHYVANGFTVAQASDGEAKGCQKGLASGNEFVKKVTG